MRKPTSVILSLLQHLPIFQRFPDKCERGSIGRLQDAGDYETYIVRVPGDPQRAEIERVIELSEPNLRGRRSASRRGSRAGEKS